MNTVKLGRMAEGAVREIYRKRGYRILAYNLYFGNMGELDIVAHIGAKQGGLLVFCEVKYRQNFTFEDPSVAVNRQKQKRIRTMARFFLQRNPEFNVCDVRFDVATVTSEDQYFSVDIMENAF